MKQLILIRGLSGSGKTTLAEPIVLGNDNSGDVSADDFFLDEEGNYHFDFKKIKESHAWCQSETKEMMEDDLEVIVVHNCLKQQWEATPYFELAKEYSYEVQVVSLYDGGLSDEELAKRCVHGLNPRQINDQRGKWDLNVHPHRKNRPRAPKNMPMYGWNMPPYPHFHPHQNDPRQWRSKSGKGY